jgi:hypothetical protein
MTIPPAELADVNWDALVLVMAAVCLTIAMWSGGGEE